MARITLAAISKQMQQGAYKALVLINVKEQCISKFVQNFVDDLEAETIYVFIKTQLNPAAQPLLKLYEENPPEWWVNMRVMFRGEANPELQKLDDLKKNLRKVWNTRPRFEQKRILDRHGEKR